MHIPDGFLPLWQAGIYYIITIVALYFALQWAKQNLDEKRVPLMAVLAAFIFAIQAMNIPIPWGTSGHMLGAALVAIVFGSPWAAVLVLAVVITIQGFFFGDGGITALGANILDMGVIAGFTGFGVFTLLKKSKLICCNIPSRMGIHICGSNSCSYRNGIGRNIPCGFRSILHGSLSWSYRNC